MKKNWLKRYLVCLFLLIASAYSWAASLGLKPESSNQSISVNTNWEFCQAKLGGIWEVWRDKQHQILPWQTLNLPHSYNAFDAVDPDKNYYQGEGWYRKTMAINNPFPNGRTILHFDGAGQKTAVYLYTKKVGDHVGGYDEFNIDLTDAMADFSKNQLFNLKYKNQFPLAICADNSRDLEMIPSNLSDFYLYGGIYRKLELVYVPQVSLQQVFVSPTLTQDFKSASVAVRSLLYNPSNITEEATVLIELVSPDGKSVYTSSKKIQLWKNDKEIDLFNVQQPQLWSPQNPALYTINVTITTKSGTHQLVQKIGFRSFEFKEKGPFFLNGSRLLLRGTHRHEDHAGLASAMTDELIRKELMMMKEMGVNFIRLGHYQQNRLVLDLCDELGIFVWEEIPWCRGGLGGDIYKDQARRMLTNMIQQHYNHPSVILWGLGNENDWAGDFEEFNQDKIKAFMSELNDLAHKLDNSRKTAIRRCDFCKDIVDVYSPSIWAGWYRGRYTDYKNVSLAEMKKVNHFFHAEWGAEIFADRFSVNPEKDLEKIASGSSADERQGDFKKKGGDYRASRDGDYSESYAVNLIDWHLKEQETMEWLTGSAYWPFKDFATPLRPDNPIPYVNQKGIVQRDLSKKEAYYVFQSYWTEKPMVRIFGHSWTTRWTEKDALSQVKVFSNCPEVELFVNGVSQGMKKRNSQDFPAAGLRWDVKFNEGGNTLKAVATKNGLQIADQIAINFQTQAWEKPAQIVFDEIENHNDTSTVRVSVLDSKGVLCLDAKQYAEFGVTGAGKLIDDLGIVGSSRKIQLQNGRASIRIKLNSSTSVASATVEEVGNAFVQIPKVNLPSTVSLPTYPNLKLINSKEIKSIMVNVCDWQLANMPETKNRHYRHNDWTNAALYTGIFETYKTTGKKKYLQTLESFCQQINWQTGGRLRHADDQAIGQVFAELYQIQPDPKKIKYFREVIDSIMAAPMLGHEDWWWCDALYMAPPALARLAKVTGESKYLDFMNTMFWDSKEFLYDKEERLFYRDDRFIIKADGSGRREANGKKVFWSRGNGWVLAGIVRVLQYMPENYPDRPKYIQLYKDLAERIAGLQGDDGLWKSSLLNPETFPHGETSGSGFYCYAMAWGVNNGILPKEAYLPVVLKAWSGLNAAVQPSGKLGWVQKIGYSPDQITADMSEVYGVGAFLLAGSELAKMK
jgi:beta-galactosidase